MYQCHECKYAHFNGSLASYTQLVFFSIRQSLSHSIMMSGKVGGLHRRGLKFYLFSFFVNSKDILVVQPLETINQMQKTGI